MNNSSLGALNALRGFPNLNFKIIAIIYGRGWDAFKFGNYSYSLLLGRSGRVDAMLKSRLNNCQTK